MTCICAEPTVQDCTLPFSTERPKDVSGCPAAAEEFCFTAFLALFLFAVLIVCLGQAEEPRLPSRAPSPTRPGQDHTETPGCSTEGHPHVCGMPRVLCPQRATLECHGFEFQ